MVCDKYFLWGWLLVSWCVGLWAPEGMAQAMPFKLQAADVAYDTSASTVIATGTPVSIQSAHGSLKADQVRYEMASNRLFAEHNVMFTDPSGTTLRVERLELTGDMRAGTLDQLRLALPQLGEVGQAVSGSLANQQITLQGVTYSPCQTCPGATKPWEIKAGQAVYDISSSTMTYHDARLNVYGVPVVYVPWFRHSLRADQPESGLLPPSFGRSHTLGEQISLGGYVWSPAENADYTFKTRLMSARGAQLLAQRRQQDVQSSSEVNASIMNDVGLPQGQSGTRGHAKVAAEYDLDSTHRVGINAETASDDTYLNQYFNRNDPYLPSTAFAEQADAQSYVGGNITWFQDLNPTAKPAHTAQVLPHLQASRWWALGPAGGQLELNGDALALNRSEGIDTRRLATRAAYSLPWWLADGSKFTLGATGRADMYNIAGQKNGAITRLLSEGTLMWEKPYLSPNGYHQITPKVLAALSPRGGNVANKIPNEDSVAYELDTTNLFELSRFAGLDRIETGPRLVYGIDNRWGSPDRTDYRLFVGQSLRRFNDASLPSSGGASTNASDWVAETEANPADWLGFNSRLRLDNSSWQLRRLDGGMRLGQELGPQLSATYSFLDNTNENLNSQLRIPLGPSWRFLARSQHDLRSSKVLEAEAGLTWLRDCYAIELVGRRKGFQNASLRPGTDYLLNFQLLTMGRGVGMEDDSR
jgi:LPS-assembly protein